MRSDAIEDRRYCRVCGAAELASAERCEECGTSVRPTPMGESIGDLVTLLNTIHQWRREGVLTGRAFLRVRFELERRLAVHRRPAAPALRAPEVQKPTPAPPPPPVPRRRPAAAVPDAPAPARRPTAPVRTAAAPRRAPAPPRVPGPIERRARQALQRTGLAFARAGAAVPSSPGELRERLSWERIGAALFSERTLQALLYLGAALVVAATLTLTVSSFRTNTPWWAQQALLIVGAINFLGLGWYARERLRLNLSGGVLLDLGALWIPLNVGVAAFQLLGWREGGPLVIGIPLDAPASFLVTSAVTVPAYVALSYRFRLILPIYGAAFAAAAAIASALSLLGASWDWQIASAAIVAPLLALLASRMTRPEFRTIARHTLWLSYGWAPAVLLVLIAVDLDGRNTSLAALALALPAWTGVVVAALNTHGEPDPRHRYLPLVAAPIALLLTLRGVRPLEVEWYGVFLAALAYAYLLGGPFVRRAAARRPSAARPLAALVRALEPEQVVAIGLSVAALGFIQTPAAAAATLALVAGLHAAASLRLRHSLFEYAAAAAFAPVPVLAVVATGAVSAEWGAPVLALTAAGYLLAARALRSRLLAPARAHPRSGDLLDVLAAFGSVGAVGLALTMAALLSPQTLASAAAAQALVALTYLGAARLYRRALFEYAATALLPVALVLALEATAVVDREWYGAALAALAGLYLLASRALRARLLAPPRPIAEGAPVADALRALGSFGAAAQVLALIALALFALQTPASTAATQLLVVALLAVSAWLYRHAIFEYAAAALLPVALVLTLEATAVVDREWYGAALAALAGLYLLGSRALRARLLAPPRLIAEGASPVEAVRALGSFGAAAQVLALIALTLFALQTPASTAVTQLLVVALLAVSAWLYRQAIFEYAAAAPLPVALVLTLEATAVVDREWYGAALAALGGLYLLGSRALRARLLAPPRPIAEGASPAAAVRALGSFGAAAQVLALIALALFALQTPASAAATQLLVVALLAVSAWLYRHAIFEYAAAALLPVALVLTLEATAVVDREWYGAALAALAGLYLLGSRALRARLLAPPRPIAEGTPVAGALRSLGSLGAIAMVLAVAALALYPLQSETSAAATQLAVVGLLAIAAWQYRRSGFEYAAAALFPVAAVHAALAAGLQPVRFDVLLAAISLGYVAGARWLRYRRPGELSTFGPYYFGGLILATIAAAWPEAALDSRTVTLYLSTATVGGVALVFRARPLAYLSAFLLFAPFALTLVWLEAPAHVRALALLALAVAELAAAEAMLARARGRALGLGELILDQTPARPLFANPLSMVGAVALAGALVMAAVDAWIEPDAALAPWTFVAIAVTLALGAVARRSTALAHAAAWVLLPSFFLLGERGFYVAAEATPLAHARNLALIAGAYFLAGVALDRFAPRYAGALLVPAYLWLLAAAIATVPERSLNTAVVGGAAALFGAAAVLVHFGRQRWFLGTLEGIEPLASVRAHARNVFQYLATALAAVAVLLAVSLGDPPPEHYGFALVAMAALYLAAGRLSRRIDLTYRHAWYLPGYAMSVAAPLVAVVDVDAFLAVFAGSIALYSASAIVSRQVRWVWIVVVLVPIWVLVALGRFDVPTGLYGPAALALAFAYTLVGYAVQVGPRRLLRESIAGEVSSLARPFLAGGLVLAVLGVAHATLEDRMVAASTLAAGSAYSALAFAIFRRTVFLWGVAILAAAAYVLAVTLATFVPDGYEGVALAPGALAAILVAALWRRREAPAGGLLADLLGRRLDRAGSRAAPFTAAVLAASVAMPLWSASDDWALNAALGLSALIAASFAAAFRGPLWLLAALALGDIAYVRALLELGVVETPAAAALSLALPVALTALAGEAAWEREGRPGLEALGLPLRWWQPLHAHGAAVLAGSLAVASIEAGAGLLAAGLYTALVAGLALRRQNEALAWSAIALLAIAFAHAERLAGTPLEQIAPRIAIGALLARLIADALAAVTTESASRLSRLPGVATARGIWVRPLRLTSAAGTVVALALGGALWADSGWSLDGLEPLPLTAAVAGLTVVATAYSARWILLSYAGVALLLGAYMLQLLRFEVDHPMLFTIPAGAYLLAVSFFECRRGATSLVPTLQWAGILLLLGAPLLPAIGLVESEFGPEWYRRMLFGLALSVVALGVLLQWKRPFFAGIAAFLANLLLLLTEPEGSVAQWLVFGVTGLLMMALAFWAEQHRASLSRWWRVIERWD